MSFKPTQNCFIKTHCYICSEAIPTNPAIDTKAIHLRCDHLYHNKCITNWKAQKNSCPLCCQEIVFKPDPIIVFSNTAAKVNYVAMSAFANLGMAFSKN